MHSRYRGAPLLKSSGRASSLTKDGKAQNYEYDALKSGLSTELFGDLDLIKKEVIPLNTNIEQDD